MDRNRLPPGQYLTEKFPVLHAGSVPKANLEDWRFRLFGLVEEPKELTYIELASLPVREVKCDIHCVTTWSRFDNIFEGVPASEVLKLCRPEPEAKYVMVHAEGGWTTNLPLDDLLRPENLLAWKFNGHDLTPEHGWPLRLIVPHLYFWKSAKWVRGLELMAEDKPGYWERGGYHLRGDPWKSERYRDDPDWFSTKG